MSPEVTGSTALRGARCCPHFQGKHEEMLEEQVDENLSPHERAMNVHEAMVDARRAVEADCARRIEQARQQEREAEILLARYEKSPGLPLELADQNRVESFWAVTAADEHEAPLGYAKVMLYLAFNTGRGVNAISDGTDMSWSMVLECLWYGEAVGDVRREGGTPTAAGWVVGGKWHRQYAVVKS